MKRFTLLGLVVAGLPVAAPQHSVAAGAPSQPQLVHFEGVLPALTNTVGEVQYDFDLAKETFEVFVPVRRAGQERFGLLAFIPAQDAMTMPRSWVSVIESKELICLIPQRIGNDHLSGRRLGLTLAGIRHLMQRYPIDPQRVYTGGLSGGARCALHLALLHSDMITGTIAICGADFSEPAPQVAAAALRAYGSWLVPGDRVARAKTTGRFVFVTGDRDYRHDSIRAVYRDEFVKNHFRAKFIDVPDMGHQLCGPWPLLEAIRFLDDKR